MLKSHTKKLVLKRTTKIFVTVHTTTTFTDKGGNPRLELTQLRSQHTGRRSSVFSLSSGSHTAYTAVWAIGTGQDLGLKGYFWSSRVSPVCHKVWQGAMAKIKGLAWTLFDNVINASHASPFLKTPDSINELRKEAKMRKMHVLTDMYFSFLRDKVSRSRGWPLTCYVAEDDLELLDPTTSASQLLGLQTWAAVFTCRHVFRKKLYEF